MDVPHRSWDWPEAYECWRALGVRFCHSDQPQAVTGPTGSLRRHGRKAAAGYAYRYTGDGLTALAAVAEAIRRRSRETSCLTENHVRGQVALNALELRSHLC